MPAIISLIYLMFSLLVFTKKITISNVLSAFLLFLSLYILHHKSLLIFIYCRHRYSSSSQNQRG
ncbi:putative inner membrane protein [Salmonella enterica subsp. enterica serovar Agona str. 22.H.04]|nr:membrane protein [Salmonella enterica subsp. enterica serovar Agona]KTM28686.1 membrane protein [Salmonella enterica]KYC02498.1 hypothetical protein AGQ63_22405 [Salmonella enterica subsp. enterica]OAM53985.1 hypothetical protein AWJ66_19850 [Salmonella enterica subsp. enterica serovar Agona str. 400100 30-11]OAM60650.1 hypothetical protein AWJ61_05120 [Salmonella enterica subsp. enterica serovar Agona str. 400095 22]OAS45400.1 hypothetical protein AWJ62_12770 [Salmonella enterica subsp. en